MFEYLIYIFYDKMSMFRYLKTPDIILPLVSSKKLDWTHTFGTYCTLTTAMKETFKTGLSEKFMKAHRNVHVLTDKSRSK